MSNIECSHIKTYEDYKQRVDVLKVLFVGTMVQLCMIRMSYFTTGIGRKVIRQSPYVAGLVASDFGCRITLSLEERIHVLRQVFL